jgi:tRNA A37 threonylcarbamoyladenosine dehydratase
MLEEIDFARRFGGVARLYGQAGLTSLQAAHVVVIGVGGVGSWAAEALARNAVGIITLIDLDNIAESNVNRQIHAVDGAFGKAKVSAMRERILSINPQCIVHEIEEFITTENVSILLNFQSDLILDCVDDVNAKIALAVFCKQRQIPLLMAGSAGGRLDSTKIKVLDLAHVTGDRLLAKVRTQLRRDHGFPKAQDTKSKQGKKTQQFGFQCVFSDEAVIKPPSGGEHCEVENTPITGLNCAGYGSSVCVTAAFGFAAASVCLRQLLKI